MHNKPNQEAELVSPLNAQKPKGQVGPSIEQLPVEEPKDPLGYIPSPKKEK